MQKQKSKRQFHVPIDLEPEKNKEDYFIDEARDSEDVTRDYCAIEVCPLCDTCSKQAWARACCYSYVSHEKCLQYLLYHLMSSGKHMLKRDAAIELMNTQGVAWSEPGKDTFEDRQTYRGLLENAKQAETKPKVKKIKVEKRTDNDLNIDLAKIERANPNRALSLALQLMTIGGFDTLTNEIHERVTGALTSGSKDDILKVDAFQRDIVVSSDQLKHFRDTLIRADASLVEAKRQMLVTAGNIHANQIAVREAIAAVDALAYSGSVLS